MGERMSGSQNFPARRINPQQRLAEKLGQQALRVLSEVPNTLEGPSSQVHLRARAVTRAACNKAALAAGGLALPPGPLGWLTIVPELVTIWRIQAQMVADLAGAYGVTAWLTREQMVYCLFRHATAQALRDVLARVGSRVIGHDVPLRVLERLTRAIGVHLSRRVLSRGVSRWLPVIGAVGVGAYAWYDTREVARTAIALFARERDGAEASAEAVASEV